MFLPLAALLQDGFGRGWSLLRVVAVVAVVVMILVRFVPVVIGSFTGHVNEAEGPDRPPRIP